eukprot:1313830-Rhodomonas_salina.1
MGQLLPYAIRNSPNSAIGAEGGLLPQAVLRHLVAPYSQVSTGTGLTLRRTKTDSSSPRPPSRTSSRSSAHDAARVRLGIATA